MKHKKLIIICLCLLSAIAITVIVLFSKQKVAVLGYHNFYGAGEEKYANGLTMDISKFEEQMKYLYDQHYETLTLEKFYCWKKGECKIPRKSVLITMDDGFYSNYKHAFPILKKYNMNAVVFVVGSYIEGTDSPKTPKDYLSKALIEKSKTEYPNITFASHSYEMHGNKKITTMTAEELKEDAIKNKTIIDTKYIAYPYGDFTDEFVKILKDENYIMGFGFGPDGEVKGTEHRKATKDDDDFEIPRLNISNDMSMLKFKLRLFLPF